MFCVKCGKELPENALFCAYCGEKTIIANENVSDDTIEVSPTVQKTEEPVPDPSISDSDHESEKLWYYAAGNEHRGPFSEGEIADLVRDGSITRKTMVWKEGFSRWLEAENTALKYVIDRIVPFNPAENISDKWLWALAIVPLVSKAFLSGIMPGTDGLVLTFVVIGLNILFFSLDLSELRKNSYSPESWLWLGIILVPVYLFVRAAKTTKNVVPGIIWCVLFTLTNLGLFNTILL